MNLPKRHHYVPQLILRRFSGPTERLFVFDKSVDGGKLRESSIEDAFVKKHFYSLKLEDGSKDPELEKRLANLEGRAGGLIEKIENASKKNQPPSLTSDEKADWDLFFFVQWKRTPDMLEKIGAHSDFEATLDKAVAKFEETKRPLTDEERANVAAPTTKARIKHNAAVQAVAAPSTEVLSLLAQKGLAVLKITDPRRSFIVGSSPIAKLTLPGRSHISDPSVEVWFPIAPNLAVSPAYNSGEERLIHLSSSTDVRHINLSIAKQSRIIASGSERLVKSLSHPRV